MSAELIFSICSSMVLPGWLLLILFPRWKWTLGLISAGIIPFVLGLVYLGLLLSQLSAMPEGAGFGSVEALSIMFSNPFSLTAGWVHYLAFDLFIGSWEVQDAQRNNIPHWLLIPCLLLTFLTGPVGLVLYFVIRAIKTRQFRVFEAA